MLVLLRRVTAWLALGFVLAEPAQATPLRVDRSRETMRVDGALREWQGARFAQLGDGDDAALRYALATADGGLYLALEVRDEHLVRRGGVGPGQDAVVLTLALPDAQDAWRSLELWLHPGQVGRSKAAAGLSRPGAAPKPSSAVRVVEGPLRDGDGYVIEAFLPWKAVSGAELWEQARARLRFEDVDDPRRKQPEQVLATVAEGAGKALPRLALGVGHQDFLGSFLAAQQLVGVEPRFDLRANVSGDGRPERVVLVDKYVVVFGPGFKQGKTFGYYALPFGSGGGVKDARLVDLTGDGLAELAVTLRQRNPLGGRELWSVISLVEDQMRPLFGVELRKEAKGGFIDNQLSLIARRGGPPRIRVRVGDAQGLDALTYQERPAGDAQPILLPWGEVRARSYGFDDGQFVVVDETRHKPAAGASPSPASTPAPARPEPPPSAPATQLLAHIRSQLGLPKAAQPSRRLLGNFAGSPAPEQVLVFGSDVVVSGADVAGGRGYLLYRLPLDSARDLVYAGAADVTGDGAKELFLRVRQQLSGAEGVHRELLLVLRVDGQGRLARVLTAEVTRRRGAQVVANRVRTRGGVLTILPGSAEGWDVQSYPFADQPVGDARRLLLPWRDQPVTYRLRDGQLVPRD